MAKDLTASYMKCMQQVGTSQAMSGSLPTPAGHALINSALAGEPTRSRKEPSAAKAAKRQRVGPSPAKNAGGQADVQASLATPLATVVPVGRVLEAAHEHMPQVEASSTIENVATDMSAAPILAGSSVAISPEGQDGGAGTQKKHKAGHEPGVGGQGAFSLPLRKLSGKGSVGGQAQPLARVSPLPEVGSEQPGRVSTSPGSPSLRRGSPAIRSRGRSVEGGFVDAEASPQTFRRALSPGGHEPLGVFEPNAAAVHMLTRLHTMSMSPGAPGSPPPLPPTQTPSPSAEARLAALIHSLTPASEDALLEAGQGARQSSSAKMPWKARSSAASGSGSPPLTPASAEGGPLQPSLRLAKASGSPQPPHAAGKEADPTSFARTFLTVTLDPSERVSIRMSGLEGSSNGSGVRVDAGQEAGRYVADVAAGSSPPVQIRAREGSGSDGDGPHALQGSLPQEPAVQTSPQAEAVAHGQSPDQVEISGNGELVDKGSQRRRQAATGTEPVVPPVSRSHGSTPTAGDQEVSPVALSHDDPACEGPLTGAVLEWPSDLGSVGLLDAAPLHSLGAQPVEDCAVAGAAGLPGSDACDTDIDRPESAALAVVEHVEDVVRPNSGTDCSLKQASGIVAAQEPDEAGRDPQSPRQVGQAHLESTEGTRLVQAQPPQPEAASADTSRGEASAEEGPGEWGYAVGGSPLSPVLHGAGGKDPIAVPQAVEERLGFAAEERGQLTPVVESELASDQPVCTGEAGSVPSAEPEGNVTAEGVQIVGNSNSEGMRFDPFCRFYGGIALGNKVCLTFVFAIVSWFLGSVPETPDMRVVQVVLSNVVIETLVGGTGAKPVEGRSAAEGQASPPPCIPDPRDQLRAARLQEGACLMPSAAATAGHVGETAGSSPEAAVVPDKGHLLELDRVVQRTSISSSPTDSPPEYLHPQLLAGLGMAASRRPVSSPSP